MESRHNTLKMLGVWLVAVGAWGLLHATLVSTAFITGALALAMGSLILLTVRR